MQKLYRLIVTVIFSTVCIWPAVTVAKTELKVATLAPDGSLWMRVLKKMNAAVEKETGGEVSFVFYPGAVQGDERDVVRKIRTGQLSGGAFTAVGLALINKTVLALQMPLLFETQTQLDNVREKLDKELTQTFTDQGYVLLGWADVGWIYIFSKTKFDSLKTFSKQKVWAWNDDPIAKAFMRKLGVSARMLALPQVYPSLSTGMVDVVYNSMLGAMALQWHGLVKYMLKMPIAIGIGATVIDQKSFATIKPEVQQKVIDTCRKYHQVLLNLLRKDAEKAATVLKTNFAIEEIAFSETDQAQFRKVAKEVAEEFQSRYYSREFFDKIRAAR